MKPYGTESIGNYSNIATENMFHEHMDKMRNHKQTVLKCRIAELGIDLDIEKESKKRFRSFLVENKGNKETYWYNDGSEEGLRIITFVTELDGPEMGAVSCSLKAEIKYY